MSNVRHQDIIFNYSVAVLPCVRPVTTAWQGTVMEELHGLCIHCDFWGRGNGRFLKMKCSTNLYCYTLPLFSPAWGGERGRPEPTKQHWHKWWKCGYMQKHLLLWQCNHIMIKMWPGSCMLNKRPPLFGSASPCEVIGDFWGCCHSLRLANLCFWVAFKDILRHLFQQWLIPGCLTGLLLS